MHFFHQIESIQLIMHKGFHTNTIPPFVMEEENNLDGDILTDTLRWQ